MPPAIRAIKPRPNAMIDTFDILGYLNTDQIAIEVHASPVRAITLIKNDGQSLNMACVKTREPIMQSHNQPKPAGMTRNMSKAFLLRTFIIAYT